MVLGYLYFEDIFLLSLWNLSETLSIVSLMYWSCLRKSSIYWWAWLDLLAPDLKDLSDLPYRPLCLELALKGLCLGSMS